MGKVMIELPENLYKGICEDGRKIFYISGMRSGKSLLTVLLDAVKKGKVYKNV